MYLGRQQLGTWLDVYLNCVNASRTPTLPDAVPTIRIRRCSDNAVVYTGLMPIVEKEGSAIGLFCSRLLLGIGFSVGTHTVTMFYVSGGQRFEVSKTFEIMAAGDPKGQVLAMIYLHNPSADYIVYQVESGLLMKGKNPKVN